MAETVRGEYLAWKPLRFSFDLDQVLPKLRRVTAHQQRAPEMLWLQFWGHFCCPFSYTANVSFMILG